MAHGRPFSITPPGRRATALPAPDPHPRCAPRGSGPRPRRSRNRKTMRGCGGSSPQRQVGERTHLRPFAEARRTALPASPPSPSRVPGEAVEHGSPQLAVREAGSRRPCRRGESRRTQRSQRRPRPRERVPRPDHPRTITHESRLLGIPRDEPPGEREVGSSSLRPAPSTPRTSIRIAHPPSQSTTAAAGCLSPCGIEGTPGARGSSAGVGPHTTASPALPADRTIAYTHASTAEAPR